MNNNNESGIYLTGSSNYILKNTVSNNTLHGIYVGRNRISTLTKRNLISENVVSNNTWGITLDHSDLNVVVDNYVDNNKENGIYLNNSDYTYVLRNNITNNYHGINTINSNRNQVSTNRVTDNYYGVSITNSHNNDIINNTFHDNEVCYRKDDLSTNNRFENSGCKELDDSGRILIIGSIWIGVVLSFGISFLGVLYYKKKRKKL